MIIAGMYSFKGGKEIVESEYALELAEVKSVIAAVDSNRHKSKISKEVTMPGKVLYSPSSLNKAFNTEFAARGWVKHKIYCDYPSAFYTSEYQPTKTKSSRPYREMDFVKNKLGVEVQFGKYSFMVYNVAAKMTIFRNEGIINAGIEIVPVKEFVSEMSTGVSYFEQFVWDLEHRGTADIDIPVLILGIMSTIGALYAADETEVPE